MKFGRGSSARKEDADSYPPEEQLRTKLLELYRPQNTSAIGLTGMGGIGKSCALRGLALDAEIRSRFFDGIYWLDLGHESSKEKVVEKLSRLLRESGGELKAKAVLEESSVDFAISM